MEPRSFLGLWTVFRRFVLNLACVATLLNRKLRKGQMQTFQWLIDDEITSFETPKAKLVEHPVLALPQSLEGCTVEKDACNKRIGCVVLHKQPDGTKWQFRYWSRSLNYAERSYDTTQRECLAVVWAVLLLRPWLEEWPLTVCTDYDALEWNLNLTNSTGKLTRLHLRIFQLEFDVVHCMAIKHQATDAFLLLETSRTKTTPIDGTIRVMCISASMPRKGKARVMYIQDYDVLNDKVGIGIPAAYGMATSTGTKHDKPSIATQEFIREQANDLNCHQSQSEVGLPILTCNYNRNGSGTVLHPLMGQYRKPFLHLYTCVFQITTIIQHRWDTRLKFVCMTRCDANITGCTRQMIFKGLWEIVTNAPEISRHRSDDPIYTYSW